jgi:uncharacterized membrane protein
MPEISEFCPGCGRSVHAEQFTAAGLRDAVLGGLAYVAVIPAILFLAVPSLRSSRFVRFHSWQSIFFAISTAALILVLRLLFLTFSMLPVIGFLIAWLSLGIGFLADLTLWAVLVAKAAQGHAYELPVIGLLAARLTD